MQPKVFAVAIGLCALAGPASAQIIATSIPRAETGGRGRAATTEEKFALHIMGSPLAKWNYGELYLDYNTVVGSIHGKPNSDFILAAEAAFAVGSDFSISAGGWYNKIGNNRFDFTGFDATGVVGFQSVGATIDTDIKSYEGHVGLFYRDFGVQGGIVKTTGKIGPNFTITSVGGVSGSASGQRSYPDAKTTDWDLFGVYKHAFRGERRGSLRASLAVGAGIYRKQGVAQGSPLRAPEDQTVFSAFGSLNIDVYKGFGVDVSYWYVGATPSIAGSGPLAGQQFSTDFQSRLTVGFAYTFTR